jgi:hypothetical protein
MTRREEAAILACAISILFAGVAIGASTVATHFIPAPQPSIDDGAVDFSTQPEGVQNG